jgi:hypothetical protein
LKGAPENLPHGDEVITRRYEFYKYVGPLDLETGEALGAIVAADGIHGTGVYSNTVVVGDFLGAQMSALDVKAPLGLIDHLPDGEVQVPYGTRTMVIAGDTSFVAATSGSLPDGLVFDSAIGQVSGTPMASGVFVFNVQISAPNSPALTKAYAFTIAEAGAVLPPHCAVDTGIEPSNSGNAVGTGVYPSGSTATVVATPNPGFGFVNWTDNGTVVSQSASYPFLLEANRSLVAHFALMPTLQAISAAGQVLILQWPTNFVDFSLTESTALATTNWNAAIDAITVTGTNYQVTIPATNTSRFFQLRHR